MITKHSIKTIFMVIMGFMATTLVQACPISLTNNSDNTLLIKMNNPKNPQETVVRKGQTINFGDKTQHANFNVYKEVGSGSYDYQYTVKQHACSMGKSIELQAADMPHKIDRDLFEVLYKR